MLGLPGSTWGDQLDMGLNVSATPIWDYDHGVWHNVRLWLTVSIKRTWTIGSPQFPEPKMPPGWIVQDDGQPPFCDHLVYESLDHPGRVYAASRYNVFEYPPNDGDSTFGSGYWWMRQTHCYENPEGSCDSAEYHSDLYWSAECNAFLPENCGTWRIHYVIDGRNWTYFCYPNIPREYVVPEPRTIAGTGAEDANHVCAQVDSNLIGYINSLPGYRHASHVVRLGDCPEPPPPPGETTVKFLGYLKSDGTPGERWLPIPGDSIGLLFALGGGSPHVIGYGIWDISMWQGECMNSPRYIVESANVPQPEPAAQEFDGFVDCDSLEKKFPWWDFTIGKACKYHDFVQVRETTVQIAVPPGNPFGISPDGSRPLLRPWFRSYAFVGYQTSNNIDTLWLRCHDYGAHCLVTPMLNGKIEPGVMRHMDPWMAPYHQEVWTITVPYDYDGYTGNHLNYGDGMSDYWEQDEFHVSDTRPIRPFVTFFGSTDGDPLPVGRHIDGDSWCNFAEYRGVIVRDSTFNHVSPPRHVRLDPLRKSVLVHVRENMQSTPSGDSVASEMPGYVYRLWLPPPAGFRDSLEMYFTDSIRFFDRATPVNSPLIELLRNSGVGRAVNFNGLGAGLWYYGFGAPITRPLAQDGSRWAVTFWNWDGRRDPAEIRATGQNPDSILGFTRAAWAFFQVQGSDTVSEACVPDSTLRIVVNIDNYNGIRDSLYHGATSLWRHDFPIECKETIAHEFGHTVGMFHDSLGTTNHYIMAPSLVIQADSTGGHFVITPTDSLYSGESKGYISVKGSRR